MGRMLFPTVIHALRPRVVPACRAASRWRAAAVAGACLALTAGCAPTRFETQTDIPLPLIEKIPVTVGVYVPPEFRDKVYEEKREGGFEYSIGLGKAQSAGFMRIILKAFS